MKTLLAVLLLCAFTLPAFAADDEKETDRVKVWGRVSDPARPSKTRQFEP